MPNLSTLAGRLLTQELGSEDSTQLFTTDRRNGGVFDGVREFADLTECHIRVSSLTVTGGTNEYDLNDSTIVGAQDYVRFSAEQAVAFQYTNANAEVTYLAGEDLPERTPRWLDQHRPGWRNSTISTATGMQVPECFYRRAHGGRLYLGFHPMPSTGSSASMKAFIPYVAYPDVSTNSTWVPFTADGRVRYDLRPYHQAFPHYAAHQLEKLRRDADASDRQLQKFMMYVQRYLQSLRKKGGSSVTFAKSYFRRGGGWGEAEDPRT